jgi:voltage-gated potassium channel
MNQAAAAPRPKSNSYNIFIFVLTIISLVVMVVMLLPGISNETVKVLSFYDNLICVIFLIDFFTNLKNAPKKSDYFIKDRGWLDLLGSIPSLGLLTNAGKYASLFRLARLSRLSRITRLMRGGGKEALVKDVLANRSQYTAFITLLLLFIILTTSSVLVLQFESSSPDGKILTGGDALWYAVVTLTTVGYGDFFPVTALGRITGVFIMFAGVGLIGVLASLLSSVLLGSPDDSEDEDARVDSVVTNDAAELAVIKNELAEMRLIMKDMSAKMDMKD